MKKILLSIVFAIASLIVFSQEKENSKPPYLQVPYLPPFNIVLTDSSVFTKNDLPENKNTVIIYFNTDCDHCKHLIKHITDSINTVPNTFFVLACFNKMEELTAFEGKFSLKNFENIRAGRDEKYFLPSFYKVRFTPFTAIYNKKGNLIKAYENGFSMAALKKIIK